ncbi:MAG: Zn-ribbon domain-containing OB-fold protein [Candidatus Bathyarchaeia archaeon]
MEEIAFLRDERGEIYPTIENFYKFCGMGKLMAVRCSRCGRLILPPRPTCPECYSTDLGWVQLSGRGRLETYSEVYVPPKNFASKSPYVIGIVRLVEGVALPGQIVVDRGEKAEVGMELSVDFESAPAEGWPQWPRYFFRPVDRK